MRRAHAKTKSLYQNSIILPMRMNNRGCYKSRLLFLEDPYKKTQIAFRKLVFETTYSNTTKAIFCNEILNAREAR